jgi:hypothetical protein
MFSKKYMVRNKQGNKRIGGKRMKKQPRYNKMKCYKEIKCPHYEGDGYGYKFDSIEFLFCERCNNKLLNQMIDQKKLEKELEGENE